MGSVLDDVSVVLDLLRGSAQDEDAQNDTQAVVQPVVTLRAEAAATVIAEPAAKSRMETYCGP